MHSHINEEIALLFLEREDPELLKSAASIDEKAAEILAGYRGPLDLRGLKRLSYEAAERLSNHVGDLWLSGLYVLDDEDTASALASNEGDLHLEGLRYLSEDAADGLSHSEWTLHLDPCLIDSLDSWGQCCLAWQISRLTQKQIEAGLPLQLTEFARDLIKSYSGFTF